MTWLEATILFIPFALLWNYLRRRKAPPISSINVTPIPLPVTLSLLDYLKALISWVFLFTRTFIIRPGIYYLGNNDPETPVLVTANFYLTLFLLARRLKEHSVRLLVVDTGGINVWCSAGKGQ